MSELLSNNNVLIRTVKPEDFEEALQVYAYAREYMRKTGNPDQWGTDRPKVSLLTEDVQLERLFAVTIPDPSNPSKDIICGCFAFYDGPDPTYAYIEDGSWPSDEPYKVIHSIAGNGKIKGVLKYILDFCEERSTVLRIDTYKDNQIMQHLLDKYGFTRCGIIYVDNGTPRIAYQKNIK